MELEELENSGYSKSKSYDSLSKKNVYDFEEKKPFKTYIKEGSVSSEKGVYTDYELTKAKVSLIIVTVYILLKLSWVVILINLDSF